MPTDLYNAGCVIAEPSLYDRASEGVPWRFVSMTGSATEFRPPLPLASESEIRYDRPSARNWHSRFGLHEYDIPRWRVSPLIVGLPESIPDGPITGVLWTHTRAEAGGAVLDDDTRRLANHYLSGIFSPPVTSPALLLRFMEPLGPFARGWDWFGRRAFVFRDSRINGTVIVSGRAAIGAMTPDQQTEFANFDYAGRWVAAAETSTHLRNTTIRYVGLDANGVALRVGEVNGSFVDLDAPQCAPGQCGPNGPFAAGLAGSAPALDATIRDGGADTPGELDARDSPDTPPDSPIGPDDPGWVRPDAIPAECQMEVATYPERVMPVGTWVDDCGAGCRRWGNIGNLVHVNESDGVPITVVIGGAPDGAADYARYVVFSELDTGRALLAIRDRALSPTRVRGEPFCAVDNWGGGRRRARGKGPRMNNRIERAGVECDPGIALPTMV